MTYALLGSGLGALAAVMTLALLLYKAQRETMHAGDLLNAERSLSRQYQSERDLEVEAHGVTRAQLKEARDRLAVAESQRNDAFREARDHFVERIKESNATGTEDLVSDLLAHPWPAVHGVPPPAEADDNTGAGNHLIDPRRL